MSRPGAGADKGVGGSRESVLEVAILDVRAGSEEAFERAFTDAEVLLMGSPGYLGHDLRRCHEVAGRYLLLVSWMTLEAHTEGFRQSAEYQRWKTLLHGFYQPFPTVEHYLSCAP